MLFLVSVFEFALRSIGALTAGLAFPPMVVSLLGGRVIRAALWAALWTVGAALAGLPQHPGLHWAAAGVGFALVTFVMRSRPNVMRALVGWVPVRKPLW